MLVSEALQSRFTCRAYRPTPVSRQTVEAILAGAGRAPSGGNFQPWRVWALSGGPLAELKKIVGDKIASGQLTDGDLEYFIYPPDKEPYATRRFRNGEAVYGALGVAREDGAGRFEQYRRNFEFFGAPVGLFVCIDRAMLQGQWVDLGLFLQSLMLLAREHGLHSAALEGWSLFHRTVRDFLEIPQEMMLFCGVAIGHADLCAPINRVRAERVALDEFATLRGFEAAAPAI
ncbi:MAG: nitroreductase [Caulobacterales bacterium]